MRTKLGAVLTGALMALTVPGVASAQGPEDARRIVGDDVMDSPVEVHEGHGLQHGGEEGHLPPSSENVELVGQADIEGAAEGRVADVAAYGNYAYLTVRDPENCSDAGVAVFDISDPTKPRQIEFIESTEGSFPGEGAQVLDVRTEFFRGQLLVTNNEICGEAGRGGATLVDVTDPESPVVVAANIGDDAEGENPALNTTHSAFAWQQGQRAFVVIVDNEETTDVDILEITDPGNPMPIADLDLNEFDVLQEEVPPLGQASFLHDMTVKKVRGTWTMLLSYWDGGWVLLDVDDPANPQFIADSDFPSPDPLTGLSPSEGNAHQAEFSPNNKFILGTSEDFAPYRFDPFLITSGDAAGQYEAGEFGFTVPIASEQYGGRLAGPTIYGGLGCPSNEEYGEQPAVPDADQLEAPAGEEKTVVLLRGVCFFSEKVEAAQEAGYDAVIIANHHAGSANGESPDATLCGSAGHEFTPTIAAVCIGHRAFHLLFGQTPGYTDPADAPEIGALGESVSGEAQFDGWGYVHLLDTRTLEQLDAYAIDEALDPAFASGSGDLSVHEVAVDPLQQDLAYLSYYSGGLRVIEYDEKSGITEVGHYISEEGNNFWGVETHRLPAGSKGGGRETLILASDRDSGLFIFRYTGATPEQKITARFNAAITAESVMEHLEAFQEIADDNGGTRASGTPGYDASVDYVVERLRAVGYRPTVQEFQFPFFAENAEAQLSRVAPAATDYETSTFTFSGSGDVTAEVEAVDLALVDRAASTSGCEAADFAGFTAGNIALIQRGTCTFGIKATNAAAAGASAVIVFNQGNGPDREVLLENVTLGEPITVPVVGASFATGVELAAEGTTARVVTDTVSEIRTTYNVLAETPGGNPNNVVMVGGHLDSVSVGPGINDNGSGSAAILEIAEEIRENRVFPNNKIRFAWWGAEELGLLGSEYYVSQLSQEEADDIALYLNFDMVASPNYVRFVYDGDNSRFDETSGGAVGPQGSAAIEQLFYDYFEWRGLPAEETPFSGRSDYGPFIPDELELASGELLKLGIPAGGLFTGAEGIKNEEQAEIFGGEAGIAYDPCYHQECDDLGNVDLEGLEEMSRAVAFATLVYGFDTRPVNGKGRALPKAFYDMLPDGEPVVTGAESEGGGLHDGHDQGLVD